MTQGKGEAFMARIKPTDNYDENLKDVRPDQSKPVV